MNFKKLEEHACSLPAAEHDFKVEWQAHRFLVGGKMFAMVGEHKDGRPILTVKLLPADGEMLRQQNANIIPGYYMNKTHWNSIYLDAQVEEETIKKALGESYRLIVQGLPASLRKSIQNK